MSFSSPRSIRSYVVVIHLFQSAGYSQSDAHCLCVVQIVCRTNAGRVSRDSRTIRDDHRVYWWWPSRPECRVSGEQAIFQRVIAIYLSTTIPALHIKCVVITTCLTGQADWMSARLAGWRQLVRELTTTTNSLPSSTAQHKLTKSSRIVEVMKSRWHLVVAVLYSVIL